MNTLLTQSRNLLDSSARFLWRLVPYTCPGCGQTGAGMVCDNCLATLPRIHDPYCDTCGRQLPPGVVLTGKCRECRDGKNKFDLCRAPLAYAAPVDLMIKKYKFYYNVRMGDFIGRLLADSIRDNPEFFPGYEFADAVTPVPLHPFRRLKRGFNQSAALGSFAADALGIGVYNCLRRVRHTPPQSKLSAGERRKNVRGAFALKKGAVIDDMRIILIDDVITTGATVNECAALLLEEGAREVFVLAAARRL